MAFYFPAAHARIDWTQGHGFRNTELRQVVQDAELGKRFADTLAEVTLEDGEQRWIYVHIEIQPVVSYNLEKEKGTLIARKASERLRGDRRNHRGRGTRSG